MFPVVTGAQLDSDLRTARHAAGIARGGWIALLALVGACGGSGAATPDASTDAAAPDSSLDAAVDAPLDAAVDAPLDAAVDAPLDAAVDAGACPPRVAPRIATDGVPIGIALADVDADGNRDLVISLEGTRFDGQPAEPSALEVMLGNGDGSFQPAVRTVIAPAGHAAPMAPAVADIDGDGDRDVVLALSGVQDRSVQLLLGDGHGNFTLGDRLAAPYSTSIVLADIDHSGTIDIAASSAHTSSGVTILLGTGGGDFAEAAALASGTSYDAVAVGDIEGDGQLDVVAVGEELAVFRGRGDGTFDTPRTSPLVANYGRQVVVGDLDGDGLVDVATAGDAPDQIVFIETWTSTHDGSLVKRTAWPVPWAEYSDWPPPSYFEGRFPAPLALGYLDEDTTLDIAVAVHGNDVLGLMSGTGTGHVQGFTEYATSGEPTALAVADVNGDGRADVIITGDQRQIDVVLAAPGGTYRAPRGMWWPINDPAYERPYKFGIGDLDGDDRIDYATGAITTDGPFMVRMVNVVSARDGLVASCRLPTDLQAQEPDATDIVLRDIDGDGDGDLVVASAEWTGYVSVFLNAGGGRFGPRVDHVVDGVPKIALGDLDGDRRPEVVAATRDHATVLVNDGAGAFTTLSSFPSQPSLLLHDIDGDGALDLVTHGATPSVTVRLGAGDGTFQPALDTATAAVIRELVVADVDGDGVPDLGGGTAGPTIVLTGNGDGTFETAPSLPAAPSRLLALADLDNRPPLDIVGSTGAIYRAGSDTRTETWTITAAALSDADGDGHLDPFGLEGRARDLFVLASQCR
jgi:hypothetical protein